MLAASHFPDHSLSFISANIFLLTFRIFFYIISLIIVTLRMTLVQRSKHHSPMVRHFQNKGVSSLGHQLIGGELSIELLINFPEFLSNDSQ